MTIQGITQNLQVRPCYRYLKTFPPPPRTVTVHLLHDNTLSLDNYEKFVYLTGQYNQRIKFHNVEKICAKEIADIQKLFAKHPDYERFTIGTFLKLLIPQILADVDKSIYIDSDTIINLDIKELWQVELGDMPLAAVEYFSQAKGIPLLCSNGTVDIDDYFNSGVLIINHKQILKNELENIAAGIKFLSEHFEHSVFDQTILNYSFSKRYLKLDERFNFFVKYAKRRGEFLTDNRILHYHTQGDSLQPDMRDKFNRLYFYYFAKTPWFNEDTIGNIYNGVRELYIERQNLMALVSAAVSGKRRVFVTEQENMDALIQIFRVYEGEEFFLINSPDWLKKLSNAMLNSIGDKIYFIMVWELYPKLRDILTQIGFVEWRDFINAEIFLSDLHGVKWNSYRLIENM